MMSAARSCSRRAALVAVLASALQHFKPSEPFLLPYLVRSLGVSEDEIGARVFPVYSYAAFGAMLALPAADAAARAAGAGYKSLLVVCAASRLGTRALLIFGASDVRLMQIMQVMYGISEATNVVTLCYLYRVLPVRAFADATAATGAAGAVSYVIAAELGQLMIGGGRSDNNESGGKADATHYLPLFWVSFAAVAAGLVLTLLLPGDAERSAAEDVALAGTPLGEQRVPAGTMVDAGQVRAGCDSQHGVRPPLPARLRALYSPTRVRLLSLWWALALAVLGVAENFSTNMLCAVDAGACETQSGHLTAAARIGTAVCSLAAARLAVPRLEKSTSAIVAVLLGGCVCARACAHACPGGRAHARARARMWRTLTESVACMRMLALVRAVFSPWDPFCLRQELPMACSSSHARTWAHLA